jgi:hypothetical protein
MAGSRKSDESRSDPNAWYWKRVGLRHPSTARLSNLLAVEKKLFKRVLGTLHAEDFARIQDGLRAAFGEERC